MLVRTSSQKSNLNVKFSVLSIDIQLLETFNNFYAPERECVLKTSMYMFTERIILSVKRVRIHDETDIEIHPLGSCCIGTKISHKELWG